MQTRAWLLAGMSTLTALTSYAAVEVNTASRAQIEAVKGVGPDLADRLLAERGRRTFSDWRDLMARVKGVRRASALRLSAEGLTVNGSAFDARDGRAD